MSLLHDLFDTGPFPPRWTCGNWTPLHGWTHIVSDLLIFGAYAAIPLSLAYFVSKRKDIPFPPIFWLFAAFIFSCGFGHLIDASLFWQPWYRFWAVAKVVTALASWATVFALLRVMPQAMELPGLAAMNQKLEAEAAERKRSEALVRAALAEKETLLQEIHHRVKNNLQIITSLLQLQSDKSRDPALVGAFREAQQRIRSMSLVHEKLYQTAKRTQLDFADYLNSLVTQLVRSAKGESVVVHTELALDPLPLGVDVAIPLGLIITELVTNSLKYAFRGRAEGRLSVTLRAEAGGRYCLIVADDGPGLPAGLDIATSPTMGLRLVQDLTRQIGGTLSMEHGAGAHVTIQFTVVETEIRSTQHAGPTASAGG